MDNLLQIANGEVVRRADIPDVSVETFGMTLAEFVRNGGFVVQFFAFAENAVTRLLAVVRNDRLYVTSCVVGAEFPSLTGWVSEKFHMFER
ncbi:MAG TPA: hydrogenase, partial [Desulfoprunum sp.]|nr:hydrogenase [Desulfoprunum sp.]